MRMLTRYLGIALAALLAAILAFARHHYAPVTSARISPAPVVSPPQPVAPAVAVKKPRRTFKAELAAPPTPVLIVRGARLKEKGEALGGRTPDRVDAGTMTIRPLSSD